MVIFDEKRAAKLGVLTILPDAIVTSLFVSADPPRMHFTDL